MNKDKEDEIKILIVSCQISSLYHARREGFLGAWHRFALFIIIFSSAFLASSVILTSSDFVKPNSFDKESWYDIGLTILMIAFTILPMLFASLDLVFQFSSASENHKSLKSRFCDFEAALTGSNIDEKTIDNVQKKIAKSVAKEPTVYNVLLHHCTNVVDYRTKGKLTIKIPRYQKLLMNFWKFNGVVPTIIEEHEKLSNSS